MPKPHASTQKEYVRKRTSQLIHEGYPADQAYAIANGEARKQFREVPVGLEEESPTRDPWVVAVRTSNPDAIERLAGMRGTRTARGVSFVLYDDKLSRSLA